MRLIDADTITDYLRDAQRIGPHEEVAVRELPGGVSNIVLLVRRPAAGAADLVVKQARHKLRVAAPWYCDIERIWREVDVLRACRELLENQGDVTVQVPGVLFTDKENYLYGMTAAPAHQTWKAQLLAGRTDPGTAAACGRLLGALHAGSWSNDRLAVRLGDRRYFVDLRLDPYYREAARVHDDLGRVMSQLIESLSENRLALVHGDFSPKNLLVYRGGLMLVDFEVGHFGDPAFDVGFFLSHLVLKAIRAEAHFGSYLELMRVFEDAYYERLRQKISADDVAELQRRAVLNGAACALARIDGKSPVEYLDEPQRQRARRLARELLLEPSATWAGVRQRVSDNLEPVAEVRRQKS